MKHLMSNNVLMYDGDKISDYPVQAETKKIVNASVSGGSKPKVEITETINLSVACEGGWLSLIVTRKDLEEMLLMLDQEQFTTIMSATFYGKYPTGTRNDLVEQAVLKAKNERKIK